jgi:hypothetical protein
MPAHKLSDEEVEKLAKAMAPVLADALASRLKTAVAFGDEALLSTSEAAEVVNKSVSTLEQWRMKGFGPKYVRTGNRTVGYSIKELKDYLRRGDTPTIAAE